MSTLQRTLGYGHYVYGVEDDSDRDTILGNSVGIHSLGGVPGVRPAAAAPPDPRFDRMLGYGHWSLGITEQETLDRMLGNSVGIAERGFAEFHSSTEFAIYPRVILY